MLSLVPVLIGWVFGEALANVVDDRSDNYGVVSRKHRCISSESFHLFILFMRWTRFFAAYSRRSILIATLVKALLTLAITRKNFM